MSFGSLGLRLASEYRVIIYDKDANSSPLRHETKYHTQDIKLTSLTVQKQTPLHLRSQQLTIHPRCPTSLGVLIAMIIGY